MSEEYVVLIRKETDSRTRQRIIDDVTYKSFSLVESKDHELKHLEIVRFRKMG